MSGDNLPGDVRRMPMITHDLSSETVRALPRVDLASLDREPDSPIGQFPFHGCVCGVAAFRGRPPWEHHTEGDELLLVLAGESELTILGEEGPEVSKLTPGQLIVVPQGHWHSNDAPEGVTFLYMTPAHGNEHSWEEPGC
jgi:mannose-6-phosphate isomerase-like protein (cupin superfamily)